MSLRWNTRWARTATALLGTTVTLFGLVACGSGGTGGKAPDGTLSLYTWVGSASDRAQWEAYVAAGQKVMPDLKVAIDGPGFDDYWTKVKTRLSGDNPPCLLTTQSARAQELKDLLIPLDDLMARNGVPKSDFDPSMLAGMTVDGKIKAIPYDAEPFVVFYNADKFTAAGRPLPTTTYSRDQFLADARALTSGTTFGVGVQPGLDTQAANAFADGHAPVTGDGKLNLTDPGFVSDVQWMFDLVGKHQVAKSPEASTQSDQLTQGFLDGDFAMMVDGPWMYGTYAKDAKFRLGMTIVPTPSGQPNAMTAGSGFGISPTCSDPDAAFRAIVAMTSTSAQGTVAEQRGIVPSRAAALERWGIGKPPEQLAVIKALLGNARALRTTANWNQVVTQFTQYLAEGYQGKRSAADILSTIQSSVTGG